MIIIELTFQNFTWCRKLWTSNCVWCNRLRSSSDWNWFCIMASGNEFGKICETACLWFYELLRMDGMNGLSITTRGLRLHFLRRNIVVLCTPQSEMAAALSNTARKLWKTCQGINRRFVKTSAVLTFKNLITVWKK